MKPKKEKRNIKVGSHGQHYNTREGKIWKNKEPYDYNRDFLRKEQVQKNNSKKLPQSTQSKISELKKNKPKIFADDFLKSRKQPTKSIQNSKKETENIWIKNRNYTTNPALEAEYLYLDSDQIIGDRDGKWEHLGTHTIEDPEEYWKNIPPVPVSKQGNKYVFSDGFNRVNFCIANKKKIPAVIIYRKPHTHVHEYNVSGTIFLKTVFDKDCQKHKEEKRVISCNKGGHLYPLKPKKRKQQGS